MSARHEIAAELGITFPDVPNLQLGSSSFPDYEIEGRTITLSPAAEKMYHGSSKSKMWIHQRILSAINPAEGYFDNDLYEDYTYTVVPTQHGVDAVGRDESAQTSLIVSGAKSQNLLLSRMYMDPLRFNKLAHIAGESAVLLCSTTSQQHHHLQQNLINLPPLDTATRRQIGSSIIRQ